MGVIRMINLVETDPQACMTAMNRRLAETGIDAEDVINVHIGRLEEPVAMHPTGQAEYEVQVFYREGA